jgi:hypothetical protein
MILTKNLPNITVRQEKNDLNIRDLKTEPLGSTIKKFLIKTPLCVSGLCSRTALVYVATPSQPLSIITVAALMSYACWRGLPRC